MNMQSPFIEFVPIQYTYLHKDVSFDDFMRLKEAIKEDTGHSFEPDEIRPFRKKPSFDDEHGPSANKFEKIFQEHKGQIRKFGFMISRPCRAEKCKSRIVLTFRIKEYADKDARNDNHYPSIKLYNYDAENYHFQKVRSTIEEVLNLKQPVQPAPDPPSQRDMLLARYDSSIRHSKLRKQTDAAMRGHRYDVAVNAAATLVETTLKNACIKYGCVKAKSATGSDLAEFAYHDKNGCMIPPYPVAKTANEGAFHLFRGFFLYVRNAFSHNAKVMGDNGRYAVDFLALCETLLVIIDGSKQR